MRERSSTRLSRPDYFLSNAYADINFYTGLLNYATFLALFNFLNRGEHGENIRSRNALKDEPDDFYDADSEEEENVTTAKKGHPRKLKPVEEFFSVLCCLRIQEAFLSAI